MNPCARTLFVTGTRATCMEHPPPGAIASPRFSSSVPFRKFAVSLQFLKSGVKPC